MRLSKKEKAALARLSPFQRAVLMECAKISAGRTRSYSEIAMAIGSPASCRAVANALAKNPLAPKIPCHRVIRKDGLIGGYSGKGGSRAKARLLETEKKGMARFA